MKEQLSEFMCKNVNIVTCTSLLNKIISTMTPYSNIRFKLCKESSCHKKNFKTFEECPTMSICLIDVNNEGF